MPKRSNGRVPTEADVTAYVRASVDASLRQRVLGELRDRARLGTGMYLQLLGSGTALFAIIGTTASAAISAIAVKDPDTAFQLASIVYVVLGIVVTILFVVCFIGAVNRQLRSRVAAVWLVAYEEAENRSRRWWQFR